MSTQPDPWSPGWQGPPQGQPPAWGAAPPPPYQGQPPQPYQGQPAQPGQPYPGQQAYAPQPYLPPGATTSPGQGYATPPTPPSPKPRSPRGALIALSAAVLVVVLGLVAWFVVVPLLQTGPTLAREKISAIYDPAMGSLGNDAASTSTDPATLFPAGTAGACTDGMHDALASASAARAIADTKTKGMGETGYVALYGSVDQAKQAVKAADASLLSCTGFTSTKGRLGSSPAYRDYDGRVTVGATNRSYTSATLVQYGNVVAVTFVVGITFAADRADRLKTRVDSLR